MAPRLIRRRPLRERIQAYLDPWDFLFWLSEKLDSSEWDQLQKEWATPIGILLNLAFLVARANSKYALSPTDDDVFSDELYRARWSTWLVRVKPLFESPVDKVPSTPSAHRVKVNSSPVASSPLRFLSSVLASESAESRAHPDEKRDVWELAVWDPTPMSLRLFCLLSPGHVLVYWLFLPTAITDPRPSTTVVTTVLVASLLSAQLLLLSSNFSQQAKDSSLIHKEVMNEYDSKFVHPKTQQLMRDVGTQHTHCKRHSDASQDPDEDDASVDTYTPTYIINKGFHTRPNPSYAHHVDPDGVSHGQALSRGTPATFSGQVHTPPHLRAMSPLQPQTAIRQPQPRSTTISDGGSLGVYSHANSPLRQSTTSQIPGTAGHRERSSSPQKQRASSPIKYAQLAPLPNGYPPRQSKHVANLRRTRQF
ncbi:uncharacterized protein KY384_003280 [Bacidia gigantensis]|uniref:uncharacterized protein n=1 Tax=Bacidia gigantensis TaxID=2732470 RepID=UPI001D05B0F8|nr:uncharacterized protein KY384_003280 [Bacidia gigantensis]KAG8531649.1 hypothetical protein KY384_003280 [Bacidia gigantensis]